MDTKTNAPPLTGLVVSSAPFVLALAACVLCVVNEIAVAGACWGFTTGVTYTYAVKAWMRRVIR